MRSRQDAALVPRENYELREADVDHGPELAYTDVGTFAAANGFTPPAKVTKVQVFVGGGGGAEGGGGAGGLKYNASFTVVGGTAVSVTVGDGGGSNTAVYGPASDGTAPRSAR